MALSSDNNVSILLSQLEYTLDKLHDTILESEILNNDRTKDIHSQCLHILDLSSKIYNDNSSLSPHPKFIGLLSKYINIFHPYTTIYNDIHRLLQSLQIYINNTQPLDKKVRFDERILEPYHDNITPPTTEQQQQQQPFDFNQQRSVLKSQDIQLDTLSKSVTLTNSLSKHMNNEVESQNNLLLTDLEANLDRDQTKINRIMRHHFLKDEDREQDRRCFVILVLLLVLLFLLIVF